MNGIERGAETARGRADGERFACKVGALGETESPATGGSSKLSLPKTFLVAGGVIASLSVVRRSSEDARSPPGGEVTALNKDFISKTSL